MHARIATHTCVGCAMDNDCAPGSASPTCNSYGQAGTLGFTQRFVNNLVP